MRSLYTNVKGYLIMVLVNFSCLIQRCQLLEIKCGWNTKSARQPASHSWSESPESFCYLAQVLHWKVLLGEPTQEWSKLFLFSDSTYKSTSKSPLFTAKKVGSRFRKMWSNHYSTDVHTAYYNFLVWDR